MHAKRRRWRSWSVALKIGYLITDKHTRIRRYMLYFARVMTLDKSSCGKSRFVNLSWSGAQCHRAFSEDGCQSTHWIHFFKSFCALVQCTHGLLLAWMFPHARGLHWIRFYIAYFVFVLFITIQKSLRRTGKAIVWGAVCTIGSVVISSALDWSFTFDMKKHKTHVENAKRIKIA